VTRNATGSGRQSFIRPSHYMDELTLNCWVRSEDPKAIFQVKVSSTDTVYDLQKAIKNVKPVAFRDVDPDDLTLYKPKAPISIPFESLRKFTLSENGEMLYGMYRLSNVFPEPPPEYDIHVIVGT
jgi:Crinkler effector protein N-terminal domain